MTRIRVVVTAEDIAAGTRAATDSCPVARAIRRRFPEARTYQTYWYPYQAPSVSFDHPARVSDWIAAFDEGKPVQPATFYLEGPDR